MFFGNKPRANALRTEAAAERERYIALGFIKPGKLTAKELSDRGFYAASAAVSGYRYYGRG